ncbi:PAS domain-containing sensor histidine kinase [Tsuneonella sp. YG55]|uniref:histidine kinase n=1 Tax=Tsuneonella litorea TaxID=2976475 RepID=A0A9X2W2N1_9SPHN|nr:PAS domain-containing sensor histidine kinase [Tsuneonella litorea]MCT2559853.1 PAS domain-containing sensor histidine kinase [Tsuneonella litorea]
MSQRAASTDPAVAAGWLTAIDRSQFVLELEPDGTIVRANALLCAALGHDETELIGRRHRDLFVPGVPVHASAGEPHRTIAYRAKDGRQVVVRASAIPIVGDDGRPVRLLLIGVDVSDRGVLRDVLADRDRRSSRQDRPGPACDRSGARAGAAAVLAARIDPSGRSKALAAFEGARTMLDLLEGALAEPTVEPGGDDAALTPVAIAAHVGACAGAMRPAAEDKGLVLRCEIDPDLPDLVECDPLRLRQVVLHLIGNAVRFTEKGWISVCAEPAWDDPGTLAISVADTGTGMDPGAGGGLGLAVSAEIARQMGGTLTHSSERGRGTRAELRVPLRPSGGAKGRRTGSFRLPD